MLFCKTGSRRFGLENIERRQHYFQNQNPESSNNGRGNCGWKAVVRISARQDFAKRIVNHKMFPGCVRD